MMVCGGITPNQMKTPNNCRERSVRNDVKDLCGWCVWKKHSQAYLHWDEYKGDNQLRGGADELRRGDRLLALFEDAVDPVGLGEHGRVADAHAEPQQQPAEGAHDHAGLRYHEEGDEVDKEDARQQHVAELSARGPDNGCVIEANKGDDDSSGGQDAQDGQEDGDDGPRRAPL